MKFFLILSIVFTIFLSSCQNKNIENNDFSIKKEQTKQQKNIINEVNKDRDFVNQKIFEKAKKFYQNKNYNKALQQLDKYLSFNKNNQEIYFYKWLCYKKLLDLDKAINSFKKALELDKNYIDAKYQLASSYYLKKDLKKSLKIYLEYIKEKQDYESLYNIWLIYEQEKDLENAIDFFKKSLKINPKNPKALVKLWLYEFSYNKNKKAFLENYKKALEISPNYLIAWHNLAIFYKKQKNIEKYKLIKNIIFFLTHKDKNKVFWITGENKKIFDLIKNKNYKELINLTFK